MYYDRRVPRTLMDLLLPGGALGWLVPWLSTPAAAAAGAHVQMRRDRRKLRHGGIKLYLGRTSPWQVCGRPNGLLRLDADSSYRAEAPSLFGVNLDPAGLAGRAAELREHAELVAKGAQRSLVDGEAVVHAGFMRRYGPFAGPESPLLALDSEARMGFASKEDRAAFESSLVARLRHPASEALPLELDAVALDRRGRILLVELKAAPSGLVRAAWQAAVHVARFRALLDEQPTWPSEVLAGLARDKARVGLLGRADISAFDGACALTPVVAAPDPSDDGLASWRREVAPVIDAYGGLLADLRLWRLSPSGEVMEDGPA